jgi:hypothetical protein
MAHESEKRMPDEHPNVARLRRLLPYALHDGRLITHEHAEPAVVGHAGMQDSTTSITAQYRMHRSAQSAPG